MNVLIVSQNYPPDLGAASFRMHALAKALHDRGHTVYVLAGMPNRYREYTISDDVPTYEATDCATVCRVNIKTVGNSKLQRVGGYLQFYRNAWRLISTFKRKGIDTVIATTPQILQAVIGWQFAARLNARLLLDVRDLWPETAIALGEISGRGMVANVLYMIERIAYRKADQIVTTSPGYVEHINRVCRGRTEIEVVMNGIDDVFLNASAKRTPQRTSERTKVLYAGNLGYCQNLATLVKAAVLLRDEPIEFELIGSGTHMGLLRDTIASYALSNVKLSKPVDRNTLSGRYLEADILYLQLFGADYFTQTIPSKIFDYLPFEKPIVYGVDGCAKAILESFPGTFYVPPDDPVSLATVIRKVAKSSRTTPIWMRDNDELMKYSRKEQTRKFVKVVEGQPGGESL